MNAIGANLCHMSSENAYSVGLGSTHRGPDILNEVKVGCMIPGNDSRLCVAKSLFALVETEPITLNHLCLN